MSTGVIFILDKGVSPILASGVRSTLAPGVIRAWVFQERKHYQGSQSLQRSPGTSGWNAEHQPGNTVQEDEEIRAEMNLTTKNSANVAEYVYFCT